MDLETDISAWVRLDNEQRGHLERMRALRASKTELQARIDAGFSDRGIETPLVRISDGRIALVDRPVVPALTLSHVQIALEQCISDTASVTRLMSHIKATRPTRLQRELRRYYDKQSRRCSRRAHNSNGDRTVDERADA